MWGLWPLPEQIPRFWKNRSPLGWLCGSPYGDIVKTFHKTVGKRRKGYLIRRKRARLTHYFSNLKFTLFPAHPLLLDWKVLIKKEGVAYEWSNLEERFHSQSCQQMPSKVLISISVWRRDDGRTAWVERNRKESVIWTGMELNWEPSRTSESGNEVRFLSLSDPLVTCHTRNLGADLPRLFSRLKLPNVDSWIMTQHHYPTLELDLS